MPGDTLLQAFATPIFLRKNAGTPEMNRKLADTIRKMSADNTSDDAHRAHQGGFYTRVTSSITTRCPASQKRGRWWARR